MQKYAFEANVSTHFEAERFYVGPNVPHAMSWRRCVPWLCACNDRLSSVPDTRRFINFCSSFRRFSTFWDPPPLALAPSPPGWLEPLLLFIISIALICDLISGKDSADDAYPRSMKRMRKRKLHRDPPAIAIVSRMANRKLEKCVVRGCSSLMACGVDIVHSAKGELTVGVNVWN